jgi:hypothetical protein
VKEVVDKLLQLPNISSDSKGKLYLAQFLMWSFGKSEKDLKTDYWSDLASFSYFMGRHFGNLALDKDEGLKGLFKCIQEK